MIFLNAMRDTPAPGEAKPTLRSGTDDNLVNINIGRLLNRKCDGAGDGLRWYRERIPGVFELAFIS